MARSPPPSSRGGSPAPKGCAEPPYTIAPAGRRSGTGAWRSRAGRDTVPFRPARLPAPPFPGLGSGDAVGAVGGAEGAPGLPAPGGRRRSGGGASVVLTVRRSSPTGDARWWVGGRDGSGSWWPGRPDLTAESLPLVSAVGELGYLAVELLRRGAAPKACEAVASKGWGAAAPLRHPRSCGTRGG